MAMFPDSDIAKKMTLSKGKVSYIVSDGLGPVLLNTAGKRHYSNWTIYLAL